MAGGWAPCLACQAAGAWLLMLPCEALPEMGGGAALRPLQQIVGCADSATLGTLSHRLCWS